MHVQFLFKQSIYKNNSGRSAKVNFWEKCCGSTFYMPDAFPVTQTTMLKQGKISTV